MTPSLYGTRRTSLLTAVLLAFVVSACARSSPAPAAPPAPPPEGAFCEETDLPVAEIRVDAAGARFDVRVLAGPLAVRTDELARFLAANAEAVATLLGRFPEPRVEVIVQPVGPGDDPIAFGLVRRQRGPCVLLLVRENATIDRLLADWTTTHELTHLVFPRVRDEDAWLCEGLATYYQEILRARVAMQTPAEAWGRIDRGFGLGRANGTSRTLAEESRTMKRTFAFKRVYWSGAAWALDLDVRLRRNHSLSLDDAVAAAEPAFRERRDRWPGRDLARALDDALGVVEAMPLFDAYAARRDFPDTAPMLRDLGVAHGDGGVALDERAPLAAIRRAITERRP